MVFLKYKGCCILKFQHPKLFGKYEIFTDDTNESHIARANSIPESKDKINSYLRGD